MDGLVEKACVAYNRVRKGGAVPQDTAMRAAIEAVADWVRSKDGDARWPNAEWMADQIKQALG